MSTIRDARSGSRGTASIGRVDANLDDVGSPVSAAERANKFEGRSPS
jgi:hypothetical protein